MHKLRKALAKGSVPVLESPLAEKSAGATKADSGLKSIEIPRETSRQTDDRNEDRYPVVDEIALASWRQQNIEVRVTNFSSNGVQIETEQPVEIAEVLSLKLGDCEPIDCVVRWVRENRVGLEFEAETKILAEAGVVGFVIENIESVLTASGEKVNGRIGQERRAREKRHGLVWLGSITLDGKSHPARLRNISQSGAMVHVESTTRLKKGKTAVLNLGQAGMISGFVTWSAGLEIGFRFAEPFDISLLASQRAAEAEILESAGAPQESKAEGSEHQKRSYSNTSNLDGKWQVPDHYEPVRATGRLTLEEVYATLYPNGRPELEADDAAKASGNKDLETEGNRDSDQPVGKD